MKKNIYLAVLLFLTGCQNELYKNPLDDFQSEQGVYIANNGVLQSFVEEGKDVEIKGLMVSLNRMERGKGEKSALEEVRELYGFPTAAIVSMADVVEHLYNRECQGKIVIDDTLKAAIDAYYGQYGAK